MKGAACISVLRMGSQEKTASRVSLRCRNCGVHAPDHYCANCGQETKEHPPTFREFVHEFILHYFAAEGRLWRTLGALVLHPGRLTIDYLRGRKLAYVLPFRLYLTVSIVFFLLLKLVAASGIESAIQGSLKDGHAAITLVDVGFVKAIRNADGSFTCSVTEWYCNRIQEHVLQHPGELETRMSSLPTRWISHLSTALFVLLPLFALYLKLAYWRRTYGEHFLFAMHLHSFWFLMLMLLMLPIPDWSRKLVEGYMFVYSVMALHAVYHSAWWKTLLKGMAIGVAYLTSLFVATVTIAIWTFIE
jgi:hypothetical protein